MSAEESNKRVNTEEGPTLESVSDRIVDGIEAMLSNGELSRSVREEMVAMIRSAIPDVDGDVMCS